MEDQKIVSLLTRQGRFTGKLSESDEGRFILHDAIEQQIFVTNQGVMVNGIIVGEIIIKQGQLGIMINLDSKSPLYQNYFQVISNIALVKSKDTKGYM